MGDYLLKFLNLLITFNLYQTLLSIVFSLVLAFIYYQFWIKSNLKDLKNKHENELLNLRINYENEIKTLNSKISDLKEKNIKLESITRDHELKNFITQEVSKFSNQRQYIKEE